MLHFLNCALGALLGLIIFPLASFARNIINKNFCYLLAGLSLLGLFIMSLPLVGSILVYCTILSHPMLPPLVGTVVLSLFFTPFIPLLFSIIGDMVKSAWLGLKFGSKGCQTLITSLKDNLSQVTSINEGNPFLLKGVLTGSIDFFQEVGGGRSEKLNENEATLLIKKLQYTDQLPPESGLLKQGELDKANEIISLKQGSVDPLWSCYTRYKELEKQLRAIDEAIASEKTYEASLVYPNDYYPAENEPLLFFRQEKNATGWKVKVGTTKITCEEELKGLLTGFGGKDPNDRVSSLAGTSEYRYRTISYKKPANCLELYVLAEKIRELLQEATVNKVDSLENPSVGGQTRDQLKFFRQPQEISQDSSQKDLSRCASPSV